MTLKIVFATLCASLCIPLCLGQTIDTPKPAAKTFHLDKSVTILGSFHGAAALADGITTHKCNYCYEGDPVSRFFIGNGGQWARMAPLGVLEVAGTTLLTQKLRHSQHKPIRIISWGIQPAFIGVHAWAAKHNAHIL